MVSSSGSGTPGPQSHTSILTSVSERITASETALPLRVW
jgi:hypothetical protein